MKTLISINYGRYTENAEVNNDNLTDVISHIEENELTWSYVIKGDVLVNKPSSKKPSRVTRLEDANDIGFKECKDYYRVGEGSISIDKDEEIGGYCVYDTRCGNFSDYVYTLTEARKMLREYLNEQRVLIMSEKKFYETDFITCRFV
jgi:hypothetical protein